MLIKVFYFLLRKLILLAWSGCSSCISCGISLAVNSYSRFLICSYVPNPVLVIIDVQPKELGIPTKAYYAVEEVKEVCLCSEKLEGFTCLLIV
jgi:hypothetical protein